MSDGDRERRRPPAWRMGDDIREQVLDEVRHNMRRRDSYGGLIPGAIILAVGIIFLLDSLGYVRARHFLQFWPMILIFLGVSKLARRDARVWGLLLLFFGLFLQLSELGIGHFTWSQFWPLLLIGAGVLAMWSAVKARRMIGRTPPEEAGDPRTTLDENTVFGGVQKRLNGREFRGGRLQAIFGGIEIDLRDADLAENEAVIFANAIFGGIELRVPETWFVAARGQGVFGGFSDSTHYSPPVDPDKPKKTLVVLGTALFGGVEIRN